MCACCLDRRKVFFEVRFKIFIDEIPTVFMLTKEYKGKEMGKKTDLVFYMKTE
jgi:hypothetical protein